jgi:hypothetical protein
MRTTAQKPATTPIPAQLSAPEFEVFILPHLSMPKRGLKCKLGYCPVTSVGAQLVDGHASGPGPRCHHLGRSLCGIGYQCPLSGLCHTGGMGGAGSREKEGVASGVVAHATAVACRRAPRLDGDRIGGSGVVCALVISAYCALGLAPVLTDQQRRDVSARRLASGCSSSHSKLCRLGCLRDFAIFSMVYQRGITEITRV